MCGRYYVDADEPTMKSVLAAAGEGAKTGEVFPRDHAAVIVPTGEVKVMQWGFVGWDGKPLINARSETVAEKPTFRRAFETGRCLVPASYYFEWEKAGREKIKHAFSLPESSLLYLAAISRVEADGTVSYVILTRDAWSGIRHIHPRMPVILRPELHDAWLNGRDGVRVMGEATLRVAVDE